LILLMKLRNYKEEIIKFTDQILTPSDSEVEAYNAGYEIGFEGLDLHDAYKKYFTDPVIGIHLREGIAFKDGWEDGLIDHEIGYGKSKKGG